MTSTIIPPLLKSQQSSPKTRESWRPLSTLTIKTFANNEIRYHWRSQSPTLKNFGDLKADRDRERYGQILAAAEYCDRALELLEETGAAMFHPDWACMPPLPKGPIKIESDRDGNISAKALFLASLAAKTSLTSPSNFKTFSEGKPKPKRRATFTKRARHTLLEGGAVMDRICGKNAFFITLTIPGSTDEAENTAREQLSWIMNRFQQKIRDKEKRSGFKFLTEYAPEVGQNGFNKLHLHFTIGADPQICDIDSLKKIAYRLKDEWFSLLREVSERTGVDLFARKGFERSNSAIGSWKNNPKKWQWKIEQVEKSIGGYLSKYSSKAWAYSKRQDEFTLGKKGRDCPLKRWWGMNRRLRQEIQKRRFSTTLQISFSCSEVHQLLQEIVEQGVVIRALGYRYRITERENPEYVVVNGQEEIYWFTEDSYPDVEELVKDMIGVISQTGHLELGQTVQAHIDQMSSMSNS